MLNFNSQFNINPSVCYGDKSLTHRALIISAIASGKSTIRNVALCDDVLATANCLRTLGAQIKIDGTTATVTPISTPNDNVVLDCQNSGTTARLLAGVVAGLGITATFVGDQSLTKRPMKRVIEPLTELGARFTTQDGQLFTIHPSKLVGKRLTAKVNSAQVKSAVLLAGLFAEGETQYVEPIATRTHTETMLSACGVDVANCTVTKSTPKPMDVTIPNDISSASFLIALALLTNQSVTLPNVGINEGRVGFLTVSKRAGAQIFVENVRTSFGELVADIRVEKGAIRPLFATSTDVVNAIDEIPILSVLALATQGTHTFQCVAELMHKECNRIDAIIDMARVCGQTATFDGANLTIVSNGKLPTKPHFHVFGDHRMAMCACVLSIACGGGSVDSFPVEVSFPNFLDAVGICPKKFCVIGSNVTQSKSPILHTILAKNANVCCSYDAVNLPADVTDEDLLKTISAYDGANITLPFKNRVANLLGASIPSVNTVGKGIEPTSTDGFGVTQALLTNGIDVNNKPLWIVGAGGGAEATIVELAGKCPMQVVNRTAEKAHVLAKKYDLSTDIPHPYGILTFVPECDFEQNLPLPTSCQFVFISAYNGASGLRNKANERGIKVVDGLQMLYHQGAKSFALWTNTPIQQDYQQFHDFLSKENLL